MGLCNEGEGAPWHTLMNPNYLQNKKTEHITKYYGEDASWKYWYQLGVYSGQEMSSR